MVEMCTKRGKVEFGMQTYIGPTVDPAWAIGDLRAALTRAVEVHDMPENVAWRVDMERRNG